MTSGKLSRVFTFLFVFASICCECHSQYNLKVEVRNRYTNTILSKYDFSKSEEANDSLFSGVLFKGIDGHKYALKWYDPQSFQFSVPKKGGRFIINITFPGYQHYCDTITVKPFRGTTRQDLPTVFLRPIPKSHSLDGVTVKATKVKFLYKGDTLVYNADAFETAEGSMLDALIKQLPGVELKDNGQILVNGRLVESLLLNGKPFFHGDNQIMLDNLPAYMVKNVKVYDREREADQFNRTRSQQKEYVMDVMLKKEYQIGWVGNIEGGLGTKDRYLARLFALRFTPQSRLAIYGNINNLNDNRKPGENTNWTPEKMPSGLQATKKGGLDYLVDDKYDKYRVRGNVELGYIDTDNLTRATRESYLTGGSQYGRSQNKQKFSNWNISTNHTLYYAFNESHSTTAHLAPSFAYSRFDRRQANLAATFMENLYDFCRHGLLDSIYYNVSSNLIRQYAINRTINQAKANGFSNNINVPVTFNLPICGTIYLKGNFAHSASKTNTFEQTLIDYPLSSSTMPADYRHKYLHDKPNHRTSYNIQATWHLSKSTVYGEAYYGYGQQFAHQNYEYNLLSRLEDWNSQAQRGLGELPSETDFRLRTMDAQNSYNMRLTDSEHQFGGWITFALNGIKEKWYPYITITAPFVVRHSRLDYRRGNITQTVYDGISRKDFVLFNPKFHAHRAIDTKHFWMYLEFDYAMTQAAPQMTSLLEIENTSDPLNIYTGNSRLKKSSQHNLSLSVPFRFKNSKSELSFRPSYYIIKNAIAYGYTYSASTGIRHYRPENIDGNYQLAMDINYSIPLFKQKLTLSSATHGHLNHGVDLIAEDGAATTTSSSVNTWWGTERLTLNYSLGKNSIGAKGYIGVGHVSANRLNFESYNLCDFNYGLTALINMPWALQLSTDLTMYSRRGYATSSMNTDDLVWNARLSRTFPKAGITLALDAFDILGNISNTTQVMNTQGRIETYRNSLPRYLMFHFIYRLNVKPKKK